MDDELEWKTSVYEQLVSDPKVQSHAYAVAENSRNSGDPELTAGDVEAARRYLKVCLARMTINELAGLHWRSAAALWARGIVGAARYRAGTRANAIVANRRRRRRHSE